MQVHILTKHPHNCQNKHTLQNQHIHTPTHYKTHTHTHPTNYKTHTHTHTPQITKKDKTTTVQVKTNTVQDIYTYIFYRSYEITMSPIKNFPRLFLTKNIPLIKEQIDFKLSIREMYPRILCEPVGIRGAHFENHSSVRN
jgi:hypothetical protein